MFRRTIITSAGLILLLLSYLAGSIDYSYALVPPPPGAHIYLEPESQDISALGSAIYNLTIQTDYYGGWVNLTLGELPEGITVKMIDAVYMERYDMIETPIYVTVTPFVNTSQVIISVTAEVEGDREIWSSFTQAQLNWFHRSLPVQLHRDTLKLLQTILSQ